MLTSSRVLMVAMRAVSGPAERRSPPGHDVGHHKAANPRQRSRSGQDCGDRYSDAAKDRRCRDGQPIGQEAGRGGAVGE